MKHKNLKKTLIFILFLVSISNVYAQSIGVTPEETIEIKTNTPASSYFSVSQGSDYAEKITIEADYDWLDIKEKEFILESKTKKLIKADINIKKPGTYTASLRICGNPVTSKGAVLATKACTSHKLTVIAVQGEKPKTKFVIGGVIALVMLIISFYIIKMISRKKQP